MDEAYSKNSCDMKDPLINILSVCLRDCIRIEFDIENLATNTQ